MLKYAQTRQSLQLKGLRNLTYTSWLGILLGVIMPLAAAWIYPTYVHMMPSPVVEWTRLQEIPFVLCELVVIFWAMTRGMELRDMAAALPQDIKIAFGIFLVGLWSSSLLISKVPGTSVVIATSTVLHILFGLSLFYLLRPVRQKDVEDFSRYLGLGLIVLALVTAWRFLLPPPASQMPEGIIEWSSALPGFISVRHFGSWTGAVAAIFSAIMMGRHRPLKWSWIDLLFFLSITMTIWSGTRAAILAITVACAAMVVSNRRLPNIRLIGRMIALTAIGFAIAVLLQPYGDPSFLLFDNTVQTHSVDQFGNGRASLWAATYSKWLESPWFGWGSGSTFWEVYVGWSHTQPHNFVLQFLISWGVVGAAGALWLLGRATLGAYKKVFHLQHGWPLLVGLYSLLVMASLEGMLHYPRFIMLIVTLFAMIFRLVPNDETPTVLKQTR